MSDRNTGPETILERDLISCVGTQLSNQMPTSSGLIDSSADKRRAIDLVYRRSAASYEFIELKVDSDTPLYAAMELFRYFAIYLWSRRNAARLGYADLDVIKADRIDLRVLAPHDYYDACDFELLEQALSEGIVRHLAANDDGFESSFRFECFDPGFDARARGARDDQDEVRRAFTGRRPRYIGSQANAGEAVRKSQEVWADAREVRYDARGWCRTLEDNLFQPLNPVTRAEFGEGKGDELGNDAAPGKIYALHSSAAIACNVFDYWRDKDTRELGFALRLPRAADKIEFERTFPIFNGGTPPHLDVVLSTADDLPTAIECKFTEPYRVSSKRPDYEAFKPAYWADPDTWSGLPRLRALAARLNADGEIYRHLDAPQLIKHTLGLRREFGPGGFRLLYLWYDTSFAESAAHRDEVATFSEEMAADGVKFRAVTYQDVILTLQKCRGVHGKYVDYLSERYL